MMHESEVNACDAMWELKSQMERMMGNAALPELGRTKYGKRLTGDTRKRVAMQCKELQDLGGTYASIAQELELTDYTVKRLIKEVK
jgi:DNA invertase Pin-like site-specific DNA recombinase